MPLPLALTLSALISLLGWRLRALTRGGALAACAVGTSILIPTGWAGLAALGAFFVGSSLISRLAPDRGAEQFDTKGSQRDLWQVLANGGAAALAALVLQDAALPVVTISLAAAAADTWATACGAWSPTLPVHLLTGRQVPAGSSGGVTVLGTAGAALGAGLVGLASAAVAESWSLFSPALLLGMLGMAVDSMLGAAAQGRFHCTGCDQLTERRVHRCGLPTRHTGGLAWLTNDAVNALATGTATVLGWWLSR
ncbi:MAG: DUF92 domain-containing protein [Gemmatimonadales bacterium]